MTGNCISLLRALLFLFFLISAQMPCRAEAAGNRNLNVSAAISLKEALNALKEIYAEKEPGIELNFNFGSSGHLQQQIEEGAPVDVFISAGKQQMDQLSAKGMIVSDTRRDLLGNELVLIAAREKRGQIRGFADLARTGVTLAIGQPETVPAGKYGKEVIVRLGLWNRLAKNIIFANDVRQVLAYVESGNVDAGLVYRSDTLALKNAFIAAAAPKGSHSSIVYPAAVIKGSRNIESAKKFLAFLATPEAAGVFSRYRFIPLAAKR